MSQTSSSRIRILVVDDHPVVCAGLVSMLSTQHSLAVKGSAPDGEQALQRLQTEEVDIVLLDLRMPGLGGIGTLNAIKRAVIPVRAIILTSVETDEDIYRSMEAGAHGYLLKNTSLPEMLTAIHYMHSGKRFLPPPIALRLAERMMRSNLTAGELEALQKLAKGLTNKEIGRALVISENTARNHVNSIIEKLEVADRTEPPR